MLTYRCIDVDRGDKLGALLHDVEQHQGDRAPHPVRTGAAWTIWVSVESVDGRQRSDESVDQYLEHLFRPDNPQWIPPTGPLAVTARGRAERVIAREVNATELMGPLLLLYVYQPKPDPRMFVGRALTLEPLTYIGGCACGDDSRSDGDRR
jgi:hypothetical protein